MTNRDERFKQEGMPKDWRQELVELHPEMFVRTYRGVPFAPGHPFTCGDGWREIVTRFVERLSTAASGYTVLVTQIREAHGRLAIHWRAEAAIPASIERAIEEAIALAQARSACSCIDCGAKASLFSSGGRLHTACRDHAQGVPVPVPPGMENLHVVRKFFGDGSSIIECRRYDRFHDRFVDIDPNSAGVRSWHEILAHVADPS